MEPGSTDAVRKDMMLLLSENYGGKFAEYIEKTYSSELFPLFTHDCFVVLRDLLGIEKAREELNKVLMKHNVSVAYE